LEDSDEETDSDGDQLSDEIVKEYIDKGSKFYKAMLSPDTTTQSPWHYPDIAKWGYSRSEVGGSHNQDELEFKEENTLDSYLTELGISSKIRREGGNLRVFDIRHGEEDDVGYSLFVDHKEYLVSMPPSCCNHQSYRHVLNSETQRTGTQFRFAVNAKQGGMISPLQSAS
jgi:hypothetical protein